MSDQRICWSDVWTRTRRRLTNWTASTNAENYRRAHCRDHWATHAPSSERWSLIGHKRPYREVADSGPSITLPTASVQSVDLFLPTVAQGDNERPTSLSSQTEAFLRSVRELGWIEVTVTIEERYAQGLQNVSIGRT